ncbi:hypothetical protein M408DRAFT_24850 [Serendipita vermifera MAFF 305830]|uniref:Uncharacterized protein n=1 Tax=Serendipita vermifera MAFF 305830 TaxID=933852 RepID=A0A0C2WLD4_SERVB|nr:hypothetical protein M408DRAFT_24850 [Serendipita vermifera MAFF 305830]
MSQNSQNAASQETVPQDGAFDIAAEVERASKRLRDIILGEEAARESLEALLKKRREDALDAVITAQRHLELVEAEEKRLRQTLTRSSILHEKGELSRIMQRIESLRRVIQKHDNAEAAPSFGDSIGVVKTQLESEERMREYYSTQISVNENESAAFRHFIIAEQD